jgi:hypothetical protein
MSDQIYFEALQTVQQRLNKPRNLTIHTLLFSFGVPVVGVLIAMPTRGSYMLDGRFYWVAIVWSLVLLGHGIFNYLRSGAWARHREQVIRTALLELALAYDLSTDELIELHKQLEDDIREQSKLTNKVMLAASSHAILWWGALVFSTLIMWLAQTFNAVPGVGLMQQAPIFGSLLIGIIFSVSLALGLRQREKESLRDARVRALYTLKKAKRSERLAIDDEGEITLPDESALKTKSNG